MPLLSGFKKFILRGNVVDLAVAVVVGAAFTAVVTAFTAKIIEPLIAALGGSKSVDGLGFRLIKGNPATFLDFGAVISAVINFVLVAAIIYLFVVLPINTLNERRKAKNGPDPEEPASERELLEEIRDLLAKQSKPSSHSATPPSVGGPSL
ncbi:MAG: large conductance mechanosensitive channel protein MscL [Segniliparus sp.]|uniref:large conductance mechanosensitive channel protein MscL n=1 Tax=Segniliparus sp. TaxID=2804064 RepID=UPI003F3B9FEA